MVFTLLWPYLEQTALHDEAFSSTPLAGVNVYLGLIGGVGFDRQLCDLTTQTDCATTDGSTWYFALPAEKQKGFALSVYSCPTRRSPAISALAGESFQGPHSDYAIVTSSVPNAPDFVAWNRGIYHTMFAVAVTGYQDDPPWCNIYFNGPMRAADVELNNIGPFLAQLVSWKPRDTFSWMSDGTSNQLMVGEKFIPTSQLGNCKVDPGHYDCTYLTQDYGRAFTNCRAPGLGLARDKTDWQAYAHSFGSYHTGVVNFCVGDGSVRPLSTTASTTVLEPLAAVNDGGAHILP
jgi:hypothetical protein